jgi:20S proteasome alpha/beta subunit
LKQDYKDDLTLEDARSLCLKVMSKTMDSTKLGSEKCEQLSGMTACFADRLQWSLRK